jgi:hypothetical protein
MMMMQIYREKHMSSHLLSKNIRIRMENITIFPVVLCGCETWPLTSREEHRLRVFKKGAEENI